MIFWFLFGATCLVALLGIWFDPARTRDPARPSPLDDLNVPGVSRFNLEAWYGYARRAFEASAETDAAGRFEAALDHIFNARGPLSHDGEIWKGQFRLDGQGGFRRLIACSVCSAIWEDGEFDPTCPGCEAWEASRALAATSPTAVLTTPKALGVRERAEVEREFLRTHWQRRNEVLVLPHRWQYQSWRVDDGVVPYPRLDEDGLGSGIGSSSEVRG